MAFCRLPNEIVIEIVEILDKEQDINDLIRVSTRFLNIFHDYLYCYNLKYRKRSALFWAVEHGGGIYSTKVAPPRSRRQCQSAEGEKQQM